MLSQVCLSLALALVAGLPMSAAVSTTVPMAQGASATLRGRVLDDHGAVADAEISLAAPGAAMADSRRTRTDSTGLWAFADVPAGRYMLRVVKLGYEPAAMVVGIGVADTTITITVRRAVARLDTVIVTSDAMPAHYGGNSRMEEFYRRRAAGRGIFFTREEVEKSGHSDVVPLMRRVPGARIKTYSSGEAVMNFARCRAGGGGGGGGLPAIGPKPRTPPNVPTESEIASMQSIAFFLNGARVQASAAAEVLGRLRTSEVEAIEVYRGPAELPLEAMGNACAAIYIWTRFGAGA